MAEHVEHIGHIGKHDKLAVIRLLHELGMMLKLKGENRFRAKAYEMGARAVEEMREDLGTVIAEDRLTELPGIGPALAHVIIEIWNSGRSTQLEHLRQELPGGVLELSEVPGLSLKKIQALWQALGIDSIATLRQAIDEGKLTSVKGFGVKTQQRLRQGIDRFERRDARVQIASAMDAAEPLSAYLAQHPAAQKVTPAGSLRRFCETVSDIDFVVATSDPDAVIEHLIAYPRVARVVARQPAEVTVRLSDGVYVDLHVVAPRGFAPALLRHTGSFAHLKRLEEIALEKKASLSAPAEEEAEIYARLGLPYIPPELREDRGEIEAARFGSLPDDLITIGDIRGMVHCHTVYSDGKNSIEEMARAAQALGMRYLTITDHSPSAHYAGGVTLDRLKRQWDEIARVQESVDVRILRGTESDILADGALDYPPQILEQLDIIIASIHSRLKMDEETMTRRLVAAMRQPVFKIWGHALGRLILRRDPIACHVEEVLDAVAESRAAIEINGDPHRLDLAPEWVQRARARGIRFVISTDAHSINGFSNLAFGVHTARRGWLRRGEVLNTLGAEEFLRVVRPAA